MPEAVRRGDRTPEPEDIRKRNEKLAKLAAVDRLRSSPDFAVLADFLRSAMRSHEQALRTRIVSEQDKANHNWNLGVLAGLDFALRGTETIEKSETPLEKRI